ncbi:Hsp20/alpha crystallin family protein [uncultured Clostridium sp.]|uniref:Hsp20/alpha crystallin family protein n=1 Tax=uncultured Clostridium sp. TaxID=59620 RepID=UPI0025EE7385|nr:Hsp20/alpha crystallin family protein [uncultured Clostridium sp.]
MFGLIPFKTNNADSRGGALSDFFDDFFNDDFLTPLAMNMDMGMNKFNADVRETENEYLVCAELPGVNKNDISLDFKNNNLIITAKREEVHDNSKDSYIRKERSYGQFSRSFYFDNVKQDNIRAKFENGELKIILPKEVKTKEHESNIFIE